MISSYIVTKIFYKIGVGCTLTNAVGFRLPCHSEPVLTLAWESVLLRLTEPRDAMHRRGKRIATPACGLVRNDMRFFVQCLVCNLNHCESHNFVAQLEALLEHLGKGVLGELFTVDMHHSVVQVGIEYVAHIAENFHT